LAGFQVTLIGRFWVTAEATQKYLEPSKETEKQLEEMKLPF
jgi:hypothetical protein